MKQCRREKFHEFVNKKSMQEYQEKDKCKYIHNNKKEKNVKTKLWSIYYDSPNSS